MNKLLSGYFGLIKRCIPQKKEGSAVGIDIGANSCKMIELTKKGDTYELLSWVILPVVSGDHAATVKTLINKITMPVENIYTSIYGKGTLIRYIDMPRMALDDLQNSFSIEADKYFPFTQDQIYTDCYILDPQGKSKTMKVMAAAAKKEMIDERIKLVNGLGVQTDFIGLNPVALANVKSVLCNGVKKDEVVAMLDMGDTVSSLSIMQGAVPRFNRDIYIGGRDMTKRIVNALAVDYEQAEKLKCDPGSKLEQVQDACESVISNLIQEVNLSFDYFATENNLEISQFVLTGGAAMFRGIAENLEKSLDVKIVEWNPFEHIKVSEKLSKDEIIKKSNRLGVALGLALYQYDNN